MKENFNYFGFLDNFAYTLLILAIFPFYTRNKVISRLGVKIFTNMTIFVDFTGRAFLGHINDKSSQFQVLKKTRVKFGLISKFSRNLNFRF